jgi:DNA mismatch repair protein MutL
MVYEEQKAENMPEPLKPREEEIKYVPVKEEAQPTAVKEFSPDDLWSRFSEVEVVDLEKPDTLVQKEEDMPASDEEKSSLSEVSKESPVVPGYIQEQAIKASFFETLEYIGQYHETYLLLQDETNLYSIDQHAAMERIMYEKISSAFQKPVTETYELLIPFTLSFSVAEVPLIEGKLDDLKALGIVLEEFGGSAFIVREIPLWIPNGLENEFIYYIVNHLIANRGVDRAVMYDDLAKTLACKKSIKALMRIDALEVKKLLGDLDKCKMPYTCPHGRPTLVKFTLYELEKMFKRVI